MVSHKSWHVSMGLFSLYYNCYSEKVCFCICLINLILMHLMIYCHYIFFQNHNHWIKEHFYELIYAQDIVSPI